MRSRLKSAVSNKTYTVQVQKEVGVGQWQRFANAVAASTNRVIELRDPAVGSGTNQRLYRLATPRLP